MSRPQLHTSVYAAIAPETLGQANKGKVAVITGAARGKDRMSPPQYLLRRVLNIGKDPVTDFPLAGIGQAIAVALAKSGANVALLDLDEARQAETRDTCGKLGVNARTYACNVLDEKACVGTFARIEQDLGPVE